MRIGSIFMFHSFPRLASAILAGTPADRLAARKIMLTRVGARLRPRTRLRQLKTFVRLRLHPIEVKSNAADAGQVVAALQAADRGDLYWSNEFFYRWLNAIERPTVQATAIIAMNRRFTVRIESSVGSTTKELLLRRLAADGRFPGAGIALARWLAKTTTLDQALSVAESALAATNRSGGIFGIHILENQITALKRTIVGKPLHHALRRYLGDDDGYMRERTCPFPFERVDLQENGNTSVCCAQWMPGFSIGNVMTDGMTASQIYNSPNAQSARQSVLDGSFRYCDEVKCPWISGDRLPRKEEVEGRNVRKAIEHGDLTFEHPSYVILAFDASCNLSCPSCRVHVITEKAAMQIEKEELIESSIMPLLRNADRLNIDPAGELFVSRPLRRLLSKLNRRDFPNLKIEIITNGTLFTPREWAKFPGIHDMVESVRVSMDGASKPTFEKLRRGARWEPFVENMKFLASLRQNRIISLLQFAMTYQLDNFREMPAFVDICRSFDPVSLVNFEKLENWGTFATEDYARKAVHLATHPLHEEFLSIIRNPKLLPQPALLTADYVGLI
jgi:hypothetical protein